MKVIARINTADYRCVLFKSVQSAADDAGVSRVWMSKRSAMVGGLEIGDNVYVVPE